MSAVVTVLLEVLGRTTLWLATVALLAGIVLRFARPSWPLAHRAAWLLVLLVGWTFLRFPLDLPWYKSESVAPALMAEQAPFAQPTPAEPATIIELKTVESAPMAANPMTANVAENTAQEVQRFAEAFPSSTLWKHRAGVALVSAWLLGMVVLLAAWLVGYARFLRSLRSRVAADDRSSAEWQALLAEAGVRRHVPLSMTDDLGPLLCRLPRGYELVVSEPLWRELDAVERRAILRHELAHYQRGDVWKSMAVRFLALPHWFNPASWWAVHRFDEAAEWACDHAAVGDGETTEYAKVLMRLGQVVGHSGVYGSAARGRTLATRIRRVLMAPATEDSTLKKAALVFVALFLAAASVVQLQLVAKPQTDASSATVAEKADGDETIPPKEASGEPAPEAKKIEAIATDKESAEAASEKNPTEQVLALEQRGGALESEEVAGKPEPRIDYEMQIIDLKIKVSQLKGQVGQTELNFDLAQKTVDKMRDVNRGGNKAVTELEIARAESETEKADSQLQSLSEELKLHEDKLAILKARAQSSAERSGTLAGKIVAVPRTLSDGRVVLESRKKEVLFYDGKTFSQWQEIAKTELSPERGTEAIRALAAFGAHGFGSEAAAQIVEILRGHSVWAMNSSREGQLNSAALLEFAAIPPHDSLPVLTKALKSDNRNERVFALVLFHSLLINLDTVKHMTKEMPKDPAVLAAIEEAAKSQDEEIQKMAQWVLNRISEKASKAKPQAFPGFPIER